MNKKQLEQSLDYVEGRIRKIRKDLRTLNDSEISEVFVQKIVDMLKDFVDSLELDAELQEKRRIYGNIVEFIKGVDTNLGTDREYLSAAYRLCNEAEPRLINDSGISLRSQVVNDIATWLEGIIVAVKVSYEKKAWGDGIVFKTEIFSKGMTTSAPTLHRYESQGNWDDLPQKVRERFIREKENRLEYMWYPEQSIS